MADLHVSDPNIGLLASIPTTPGLVGLLAGLPDYRRDQLMRYIAPFTPALWSQMPALSSQMAVIPPAGVKRQIQPGDGEPPGHQPRVAGSRMR